MNRDFGKPPSLRCNSCGSDGVPGARRSFERLSKTYQVIVACASCGTSFVILSRN